MFKPFIFILTQRRLMVFSLDTASIAASFLLAFLLRFDFTFPPSYHELIKDGLLVVLLVKPLVFLFSGMYRSIWKYASLQDGIEIFKVVTLSTLITSFVLFFLHDTSAMPRSIYVLDWVLLFAMVSTSRLLWRVYRETYIIPRYHTGKRTLIVGAGEAGNLLLKEIRKQKNPANQIIGFLDDDPAKQGMRLGGVPVMGDLGRLRAAIRKHRIEEVIIAIATAQGAVTRQVVSCCKETKVRFKTLPGIKDIIDGTVSISQIKDVEIEDILGREPVKLDLETIRGYLTNKRVLVTGAAGSIGSEICRQVAAFSPYKLLLFECAETPLYQIEKELTATHPNLRIIPVIGDVRDQARVEAIFDEFQPEVVFHAAAYKHVPMMEYNPVEAVTNNIGGTRVLANAAHRFGVKNFVMISTDKAVNPTNIMGASKRVAEIYVQSLARRSRTNFTTVRFGNVLGSNGSVIPLFKEQIKTGGPVTVTDPKVIRYFMTIPEACQLVLQAGCIGNGGEIFVLDMGDPVRILDLAEELIRLSGFVPHEEIDIVFTGLRPGEKLFEELLIDGEGIKPTRHEKIKVLAAMDSDFDAVERELGVLFAMAGNADIAGIVKQLRTIVPEFSPQYSFNGAAPVAFQRVRPDLFPPSASKVVKLQKQ
ncbi:polysaccharide biosynthesis protein [Geobacter hydrogenophilus]|uniref:Nucleoside-diphosphate sugar epimerase n=1 Tax=Geobacter hydrogenophilus TaxID=40983 RepID=A0A9W6LBL8_9BACT|nr:nucleoside-diphosphate sugar epimerase/dehydratase [Geobacter hydrogenophilus]GLI36661.1 nucleoside-diphosphate sugar epimerase [Geobacter hydrogenophilus]